MIVVVMPSRGRPRRAAVAIQAIRDTAALVSTSVVLAVDADDPELPRYQALTFPPFGAEVVTVVLQPEESGDLVKATNTVSMRIAQENPDTIIGNFGDDHVARSHGWDRLVEDALATPGIAYGDDLFQGEQLPTAPFISASIANALGWYALPTCRHLFIDNVWRNIGLSLGILRYLPEVVIEHVHPDLGKTERDEGYLRANSPEVLLHDGQAHDAWLHGDRDSDLEKVRSAIELQAAA